MPFTLAHAAAALPFRRTRLNFSAVIVGTFAPDFEYFLRLGTRGAYGHSLAGIFVLSLPLALVVFWLFHRVVKVPLILLLPDGMQRRLMARPDRRRASQVVTFAVIVVSALLGIVTHIVWDSFTHSATWVYQHWAFLSRTMRLPVVGTVEYYKLFQHGSTVVGTWVLVVWFWYWWRTTSPGVLPDGRTMPQSRRLAVLGIVLAIAVFGAMARAFLAAGLPNASAGVEAFVAEAVCTLIALIWWQLVGYGFFSLWRDGDGKADSLSSGMTERKATTEKR